MDLTTVTFVLMACRISYQLFSPLDVKKCELLCQNTGDCTAIGYSRTRLTCILKFCPSRSRMVPESNGNNRTIKNLSKRNVLAVRSHMRYSETFLIDPQTGLTSSYQEINISSVRAMAYLSSIHKFVIVRWTRYATRKELWSMTFSSSELLRQDIKRMEVSVSIDDDQHLVFLCDRRNSYYIVHVVNADTRETTVILREKSWVYPVALAVDATRNRVYVNVPRRLMSVSYDGVIKRIVSKVLSIRAFCLSENGEFLYMDSWFALLKLSVDGKSKSKLLTLNKRIKQMLMVDEKLIMLPGRTNELHILDLKQNASKSLTVGVGDQYTVSICFIN